jgi:hypothetical protein
VGRPRIHGELLKLGFEIAESTVSKYMIQRRQGASRPGCEPARFNRALRDGSPRQSHRIEFSGTTRGSAPCRDRHRRACGIGECFRQSRRPCPRQKRPLAMCARVRRRRHARRLRRIEPRQAHRRQSAAVSVPAHHGRRWCDDAAGRAEKMRLPSGRPISQPAC